MGRSTARRLFLEAQARFECALDWSARAVNDGYPTDDGFLYGDEWQLNSPDVGDEKQYLVNEDGVVVEEGEWRFLLPFWNVAQGDMFRDRFGLWAFPPDGTGIPFRFTPRTLLFDANGDLRQTLSEPRSKAFSVWAENIPHPLRWVAGRLGRLQLRLMAIAHDNPRFAGLVGDAPKLVLFVLTKTPVEQMNDEGLVRVAENIATHSRTALVSEAVGCPIGPSAVRLLERCLFPPLRYRQACDWFSIVIAHPRKRRALTHFHAISPAFLSALVGTPDWVLTDAVVKFIDEESATVLEKTALLVAASGSAKASELFSEILSQQRSRHQLLAVLRRFQQRLDSMPPPFDGRPFGLYPLETSEDFRREGLAQRNCLRSMRPEDFRVEGGVYHYRYEGGGVRATVRVKCLSNGAWIVAQALGPRNRDLSVPDLRQIEQALEHAQMRNMVPAGGVDAESQVIALLRASWAKPSFWDRTSCKTSSQCE